MISLSDSQNTIELKNCYLLLPSLTKDILKKYKKKFNAKLVKKKTLHTLVIKIQNFYRSKNLKN